MFEGPNLLFFLLFLLAVVSFFLSFLKKCNGKDKECCKFYECKKKSRKYWACLMGLMVLTWIFSGEGGDIYLKIAFWTLLLSIFIAACTCIVLIFKNLDLYSKSYLIASERAKGLNGIKALREKAFIRYPIYYLIVFVVFFGIAFKDDTIINFFNKYIIGYLNSTHSMNYSDFKIIYSLIYLFVYVILTNNYINVLKKEKITKSTVIFDEDIKEFTSILHKIDLPVASSFLFFTFVFCFLRFHPIYNNFLNYYVYGGTSLHVFLSTFIFLYGYGEEYFGLNFIKLQRVK